MTTYETKVAASLLTAKSASAAMVLCGLMSEVSELHYCAGWLSGLEFSLWSMLHGGSRKFGLGTVSQEHLDELRRLHEESGGWWYRSDDASGELFLATDGWLAMYERETRTRSAGVVE